MFFNFLKYIFIMNNCLVLVFHREENTSIFEDILIGLQRRYTLVSIQELEKIILEKKIVKNICHITFDDGEESFYSVVFPLLKKYSVPATLFVSPLIATSKSNFWFQEIEEFDSIRFKAFIVSKMNLPAIELNNITNPSILKCLTINKIKELIESYKLFENLKSPPSKNMTLDQIIEVEKSNLVTIGAHTQNHPILLNETDEISHFEITRSIKELEKGLGHPVKYFAYPNGEEGLDFRSREVEYLKTLNISLAFSTEYNKLSYTMNPLKIPRMSFPQFAGLRPSHPLLLLRLYIGKRLNKFTPKKRTQPIMRKECLIILNEHNIL